MKRVFLAIAIIAALGTIAILTTTLTATFAAVPVGCTGDPHDRDAPTGNPHDSANSPSGTEGGNPHDVGGFHDQHEHDSCPGSQ